MKVLSVGCGGGEKYKTITYGDVNVDIEIPTKNLPNFVRASMEYLPFKSKAFNVVKAFNVLEHIKDWKLGVKETLRVSTVGVSVRLDGIFAPANWIDEGHEWINVGKFFLKRNLLLKKITFFLKYRYVKAFFCRFANLINRWNYYFVEKKSSKWISCDVHIYD